MYTLPELITIKLSELFGAIQYATDDLKIAGAEANLNGDFSQVTLLNDTCRKLQALEADIKLVLNNFETKPKSRLIVESTSSKTVVNRSRKRSGRLRVKFLDKEIEKEKIADTFVEAIKSFGLEQVAKLNKTVVGAPLLAKSPINGYQRQKRIENWYITTHVNTQTAKSILEEVSKELKIPIRVEIVQRG
jgi:hypothetical protein